MVAKTVDVLPGELGRGVGSHCGRRLNHICLASKPLSIAASRKF